MKIVHGTIENLFQELQMKGIKEARAETVAITRTIRNVRWVHLHLYVTAKVDGVLAEVVIPYHALCVGLNNASIRNSVDEHNAQTSTIEGMVQQQGREINAKGSNLLKNCLESTRKNGIRLMNGAYVEGVGNASHAGCLETRLRSRRRTGRGHTHSPTSPAKHLRDCNSDK